MMTTARYRNRQFRNKLAIALAVLATALGAAVLFWILASLATNGLSGLSKAVFTQSTPPPGSTGGLLNAIIGSLAMVCAGTIIATPIGILAGIYLAEISQGAKLASVVRFVNDLLLSAPSIVLGLFVYAVYVAHAKHFSGWAGAVALSLIAIPIVTRTTETMLTLIPNSLREAAYALGSPRWIVVKRVTLRAARAGLITGVLLAVARISGETAPLLFTALNNQFLSTDMNAPMANLPVVIFQFAMSPYDEWKQLAWVGALLISVGVLTLSFIARHFSREKK
jgi:phosphate transport system permease protein